MPYAEVAFQSASEQNEILIAFLLPAGYESFLETDNGLRAYIPVVNFSEDVLQHALSEAFMGNISYSVSFLPDRNWNEEWEKNFEPVLIGSQVYVRAPFHKNSSGIKYDLVIEPKMSFGTGHHATTSLVMEEMLKMDFVGRAVLDMGCGSGILAILAAKMEAKEILAVDVDEWAYTNAMENCRANSSQHIVVQKGDADAIPRKTFDVILANINRNILLADMKKYADVLKKGGDLLLSGFLEEDRTDILNAATDAGLTVVSTAMKNSWTMLHLLK